MTYKTQSEIDEEFDKTFGYIMQSFTGEDIGRVFTEKDTPSKVKFHINLIRQNDLESIREWVEGKRKIGKGKVEITFSNYFVEREVDSDMVIAYNQAPTDLLFYLDTLKENK